MKILILEPYLTDSHKKWLQGFENISHHDIKILSLPGRHWKWRMHGAAISFALLVMESNWIPEIIIASDMLDLNVFLGLTRKKTASIPVILYFHENQLTYPSSAFDMDEKKEWDNHYAFINYTSALSADKIIFNSHFHKKNFLEALPEFIKKYPRPNPWQLSANLFEKSLVIEPGIDIQNLNVFKTKTKNKVPIIIWNHRWEYDKNPSLFFNTLFNLKQAGYLFYLVVLGKAFARTPPVFEQAKTVLSDQILHYGYLESAQEYYEWLWKSDIVISTSNQDYFGISLVEAILCQCFPIAPNKLAFPEHIPDPFADKCLYSNEQELENLLVNCLDNPVWARESTTFLSNYCTRYDLNLIMKKYQILFDEVTIG